MIDVLTGFALIRHGDYAQPAGVPSAHLPHPLTDEGREQARAGAIRLADAARERGWTLDPVIDASPLLRAWETAVIAAGVLGLEVVEVAALTERCVGAAANLTVDEIAAVIDRDPRFDPLPPGWKRRGDFCLPLLGAESLIDAGRRVAGHLRARRAAGLAGIKLVVGHGGSLRHGAVELGILGPGDPPRLSMHHGEAVVLVDRGDAWERVLGDWKRRGDGATLD